VEIFAGVLDPDRNRYLRRQMEPRCERAGL
jgi:hypothetical protein